MSGVWIVDTERMVRYMVNTTWNGYTKPGRSWKIIGDRPDKGDTVTAILESDQFDNEEEARLFGAGQLRGMGFFVENVRVEPA